MPPHRTFPPAKPVKTERTHEENQERAYIAASRRSDRSLEARVESARRASEIHKRRTGRSLRVTEQDVINEEMYEEEDDDIPLHYRRLTSHLMTGSLDFNRRLAAYLRSHMGMRDVLEEAVNDSYAQQFPNAPQFPHNNQSMQSMLAQPFMMPQGFSKNPQEQRPQPLQQQSQQQTPEQRQQQPHSQQSPASQQSLSLQQWPHPFRNSPYPMPGAAGYRPNNPDRTMSMAAMNGLPGYVGDHSNATTKINPSTIDRRGSMPVSSSTPTPTVASNVLARGRLSLAGMMPQPQFRDVKLEGDDKPSSSPSVHVPVQLSHQQSMQAQVSSPAGFQGLDFGAFTTTLPMESQQMFYGANQDFMGSMAGMSMPGDGSSRQPYFNLNSTYSIKAESFNPSFDGIHAPFEGMNSTLAPSALDLSPNYSDSLTNSYNSGLDNSADLISGDFKGVSFSCNSGSVTPVLDGAWDSFIDDTSFTDNPT